MHSLTQIMGKFEGGKNLFDYLERTDDGQFSLGNFATFLFGAKRLAVAAIASQRRENFDKIYRAVNFVSMQLDAYLRAVEEGEKEARPEWPINQVQFLLATAECMRGMLDIAIDQSLSQEDIDAVENTPEYLQILEELAEGENKVIKVPVPPTTAEWVRIPEPYDWLASRYLVSVTMPGGYFWIEMGLKGEATLAAVKAQRQAKVVQLPQ